MTAVDLIVRAKKQPVGFVCGLFSVVLAGLLYYHSSEIEEKQAEYETKSAEAAKVISNVAAAKNLAEQVEEIQGQTKDLESRLVHAGQLAANQQYFYKLEKETGVKLLDVRQNTLPQNGTSIYGGIPYNVIVQGSYNQVMVFLNRLENGQHFCRFGSAIFGKISGAGETSSQNMMTLSLNLELLGRP